MNLLFALENAQFVTNYTPKIQFVKQWLGRRRICLVDNVLLMMDPLGGTQVEFFKCVTYVQLVPKVWRAGLAMFSV